MRVRPSVVLFLALFTAQAGILVTSPILPAVAEEFGVSTGSAGMLRAASGLTAGVAALMIAAVARRTDLARMLELGLALMGVASVASAVAPTFAILVAVQVLVGLALALVLSAGLAASDSWAGEDHEAKALSWALIGQPVAWVVGQPLAGSVAEADWRLAFLALPLTSSVVALIILWLYIRGGGVTGGSCEASGLWQRPGVRPWVAGEVLAFSAWTGTLVFSGALLIESYDLSVFATGTLLGLGAAAYLPGNFLARRHVRSHGRVVIVASALALAAGVAVFGTVRSSLLASMAVFAALCFLAGARTIAGAAVGLEAAQGRRLAAMSTRTACLQFGYFIGSAVGGAALGAGGYASVGLVFAVLFTLAAAPHASPARAQRLGIEGS